MKSQEFIWDHLYVKGLSWKKSTTGLKKVMRNKDVLELGVGNGKTLKSIISQKPKKVTAIDISIEAIKIAREAIKSNRIVFLNEDFLKFKTKSKFEVIVCYYFLNNFKKEQRKKVIEKISSLLEVGGTILFEDFSVGDYRQNGQVIEKNTIQKQNGLICHFFEKNEILDLFKEFNNIQIEEKIFSPIKVDDSIKRKIIKATIKLRAR